MIAIINLWFSYYGDGGVSNTNTFIVKLKSYDLNKDTLTNVFDETMDKIITQQNITLSSIILEIDKEIKDDNSVFYRNVKKFVRLYDKDNLREKDEDEIAKFLKTNKKLCVQLLLGLYKKYNDYYISLNTEYLDAI